MKIFGDAKLKRTAAAAGVTAALILLLALRYDFWFDINDDVWMKDIISGVYTGTPSARNIQMLFPVSGLVSLFYRITRSVDWYGLFLLACQFGSLFLVLNRACAVQAKTFGKADGALALMTGAVAAAALLLPHYVFVQYTLTVGMLCGAAAYLIQFPGEGSGSGSARSSSGNGGSQKLARNESAQESSGKGISQKASGNLLRVNVKETVCRELPPVLLIIFAFLIRTEMTALMLPLVLTGMVFRFVMQTRPEDKLFSKKNIMTAILTVLMIGIGMAAGLAADRAACSSAEWREFRDLFDARTEVYDFYLDYIPTYEEDGEFFDSIGLPEASAELLTNYNFGLDERIDADLLWQVRDYARQKKAASFDPVVQLKGAVKAYVYRVTHLTDGVYSAACLILYLLCLAQIIKSAAAGKKATIERLGALLFLAFVRTGLWMFILYRGRDPERITHSLFLLEIILLAGYLQSLAVSAATGTAVAAASTAAAGAADTPSTAVEKKSASADSTRQQTGAAHSAATRAWLYPALFLLAMAAFIPGQLRKTDAESARREDVNREERAFVAYCAEHPENYYFTDVYATVRYTQKMFGQQADPGNHDLMGGWISKSPLYEEKLRTHGLTSMKESLLEDETCYFVTTPERDVQWLADFYASQGIPVRVEQEDAVSESWCIFRVTRG